MTEQARARIFASGKLWLQMSNLQTQKETLCLERQCAFDKVVLQTTAKAQLLYFVLVTHPWYTIRHIRSAESAALYNID